MILGGLVTGCFRSSAWLVRFSPADEKAAADEFNLAMARRREELKDAPADPRPHSGHAPSASDGCAAHLPRHRAGDQGGLLHHEHGRTGSTRSERGWDKARR